MFAAPQRPPLPMRKKRSQLEKLERNARLWLSAVVGLVLSGPDKRRVYSWKVIGLCIGGILGFALLYRIGVWIGK